MPCSVVQLLVLEKVELSKIAWSVPIVQPNNVRKVNQYKSIAANNVIPVSFCMRQCETFSLPQARSTVWPLGVSSASEKPRWVVVGLQTDKSGNQENNAAVFIHAKLVLMYRIPQLVYSVASGASIGLGRHASGNLVNIMSVNSILVHCNIIHSSYTRGTQAPVAYNFFPNAAPGQKILEAPHNLIYLPVTVDAISTLSVWLTDQHGKLLRGEELTIRFHLRAIQSKRV